jgi:hypothetical protein
MVKEYWIGLDHFSLRVYINKLDDLLVGGARVTYLGYLLIEP